MLALPVAWAARRLLPFGHTKPFDWRVFAFAGGLSLAAGVAFSLVPALRATRAEPSRALKEQSRSVTLSRSRLRPGPDRGPSGGVAGAARRRRALPEDPGQPAGRRRRIQPGPGAAVPDGLDPERLRPRGVGRAVPSSSPCSTTPAPASPRLPVYASTTFSSIGPPPCFCTARDARSVPCRSGRAPLHSSGGGFPESIEAPTAPSSPIAQANPCPAPASSINCGWRAERPPSVTPLSRRGASRPTRYATRPQCICSSPGSTSPSLPSGSATRTQPQPISTSKPTWP